MCKTLKKYMYNDIMKLEVIIMENNNNEEKEIIKKSEKENFTINKQKQSKKKLWIIISIIMIIVIIGIIIYDKVSEDIYIEPSGRDPGRMVAYKPIIYLYPKDEIEISIKLGKEENITCSYPKYKDEWNVIASSDGTLLDTKTGRKLYALYWEGIYSEQSNYKDGFVVKGSEIIDFLEEKLAILGLNEREAEEFIIYWLPKLQKNEYNYIRFATMEEINKNMPLEFSVKPDTLIRVLMQYKSLDKYVEIQEQELETPERNGFVVVEWGGSEKK